MSYKQSTKSQQRNMFTCAENTLSQRGVDLINDPLAWHNVFYETVALNINEDNFRPLYKAGKMGAPTKNIYRVVSMIIIKDGLGISDQDLELRVNTDLAFRRALGMFNGDDEAPSIEAYYLIKRRLVQYEKETGIDLMATCYKDATKVQLKELNISGKVVRMDSKLIGSNIAAFSRYQIVHETLKKELNEATIKSLPKKLQKKVREILKEDAEKVVYKSDNETLSKKFTYLGRLVHAVLAALKKTDGLLHRVFYEQYNLVKECDERGKPRGPKLAVPIPNKKIKSTSVQNPNDPDAEYRKKNSTSIKGYVASTTETLEDGKPSLIVQADLMGATTADQDFTQLGVEGAKELTGETPEQVHLDGSYQSQENRDYFEANNIEVITSGLQGKDGRFDLKYDENGNLIVFDKIEGKEVEAVKIQGKDQEKWRIKIQGPNGKWTYRYFLDEDVKLDEERRRLASIPQEIKNKRNNVESTMFCLGCNFRNHKTRYRGLARNRIFLYARCMWINFRRIRNYKMAMDNMPV